MHFQSAILQLFLSFIIIVVINVEEANASLKMVHVLYRHGAKTPDPSYFVKLGLLTEGGKQETFELGEYLRNRYKDFLNLTYDVTEVEFVSSAAERAVQSAQLLAYGLYRDYNMAADWSPREKIPFDPVPVQTIPTALDRYLQALEECPRRDDLKYAEVDKVIQTFVEQNPDIVSAYVKGTGDPKPGNSNLTLLGQYDPLIAYFTDITYQVSINASVPDWTIPLITRKALTSLLPKCQAAMCKKRESQRLTVGPLIKLMIEHMNAVSVTSSSSTTSKKLYSYASHDSNLICFFSALGVLDPNLENLPPTSSAIIVELHSTASSTNEHTLKVYFRNDKAKEPEELTIPGCSPPCSYVTFLKGIQDVIPENYEQECQKDGNLSRGFPATKNQTSVSPAPLIIFFLAAAATMVGIVGYRKLAASRNLYKEI